ncbi:BamA/TamA family outer membrane protein [Candidatus Omnitrophota bacterium]
MKRFTAIITRIMAMLLIVTMISKIVSADQTQDSAQIQEKSQNKRQVGAFPVVFYSDETKLAGGGAAQIVFGDESERFSSSVGVIGFYTQKSQYSFGFGPEVYLKNGTYKMTGDFGYLYFPDTFFGIGNNTIKDDEENYTGRLYRIKPVIQRKIYPNLFVGVQYDYAYGKLIKTENGGQLERGLVPGSKGGGVSGIGVNLTWDSRDNNLYPVSGSFHQFSASSYGSVLGSDFDFNSYLLDLRHYRQIFGKHIIAFQGVASINSGRPSFQFMNNNSSLGMYLRGYSQTRFVDRNVVAFQAEYRMPLYWRFGLVAFAGFGQVADKIGNMEFDEFKPSAGLGLRFALIPEQKVNLRIDIGVGKDDGSFDINIMETF